MLHTLIRKEILNNLLNLRFTLAYFICAFLLVGSAIIMSSSYMLEKKNYDVNTGIYNRNTNEIDDPWDYCYSNKIVMREPAQTKILAVGGEKDADCQAEVAPEFSPYFHGDFKRNPLVNLFPTVDMAFIVGVILSLIVFMLTYDAVSGEREEGTLKVLLSGPVPRDQVLVAKWIGGFVSIAIPYVTSAVVILLILALNPEVTVGLDGWLRVLGVMAVCLMYLAVIFSLSIMISAIFRLSNTAILALLLVWAVGIVAVPSFGTPIAYLLAKPPSAQMAQIRMLRLGPLGWAPVNKKESELFVQRYGDKKYRELSQDQQHEWDKISNTMDVGALHGKVDGITAEGIAYYKALARIDNAARWIGRLSPFGCFTNACVTLAGTDIHRELELSHTLERYAHESLDHASEYLLYNRPFDTFRGESAPRYVPVKARFADSVGKCAVDLACLAAMGILFFLAGFSIFIRSEIS